MYEFLLIRHCHATGQAPDAPLSHEGVREARQLASVLNSYGVDRLVSSPFQRARDTIEPFAQAKKLALKIDDRLSERLLADPPVADWREYIRRSFDDYDSRAPGGESARDVLLRGWAAISDVLAAENNLPAFVTHGHFIALVLHSLDDKFSYSGWESLRNPDIFRVYGPSRSNFQFERLPFA
ncbi:MAG: histidine phosphatase family protein [Planctomycetota bacterium]